MNKSNWNYPTTVWVGEGRIKDLYLACNQLKIKKPLFVTDNDLVQSQMVKKIIKNLKIEEMKVLKIYKFLKRYHKNNYFVSVSSSEVITLLSCLLYI